MPREILALIPARGGSKSIPLKNIRLMAGQPMLAYTVRAAREARCFTRIVVSTDHPEIARIADEHGAETRFLRPAALAGDHVPDLPVFHHALEWLEREEGYLPDVVVHLRPTAPLRTARHIEEAVLLLLSSPMADSVRSVSPAPVHPLKMWRLDGDRLAPFVPAHVFGIREAYNQPRQSLPPAYVQNGAVDVMWRRTVVEGRSMSGEVILYYLMDEGVSVNVDSELDFLLAERLLLERREEVAALAKEHP
ncbi:MAG: acylneuraminate cytidylyltransferase family protein [Chloroflexi bacterium]|nr:acylneuraminate cytidylyltransferase family protein [Chloroflexota bacterium]